MLDGPEAALIPAGSTELKPPVNRGTKKVLHEAAKDSTETHAAAMEVTERVRGSSKELAADSPFTLALFDDPMIKSLQVRRIGSSRGKGLRNPQYISSRRFTRALLDTLLPDAVDPRTLQQGERSVLTKLLRTEQLAQGSVLTKLYSSANNRPDGSLKKSLQALIAQAEGSLEKFETSVESWYDDQMARISGGTSAGLMSCWESWDSWSRY